MARYRHILTDLRTGRVLSDAVALNVSSYSRRLSGSADLTATLDLADPSLRALDNPTASTEPRRTALWIIRDERPVWGGIIWTRRYRSADHNYDIGASTFESYFARRRIRFNYLFPNWDQHDIVTWLIRSAQNDVHASGNVGIVVPPNGANPSGILRERNYWWHERATYLERLQQLAEVIDGPDFTISPEWGAESVPRALLYVGTPITRPSERVLEFPGDFRNYSWPDDGGNSANFWTAIGDPAPGAAEDAPPQMRDAQMSAEWDAGIPLLEDVSQHQGVTDPNTLQGYAVANVAANAGNRVVPEATLRLPEGRDSDLPLLGDTLQVRVTDPYRWPERSGGGPGVVARVRLTAWTVYLSEEEGETVSLTLSEARV